MVRIAFKEWAAICRALSEGRQSLILRKGGIAEEGGRFRPEHDRFLLYPTYFHERDRAGIKPDMYPLAEAGEAERPMSGSLAFDHFVEVASVAYVSDLERALALDALHGWTEDAVRQRFHYRTPGLYVLVVRTYRLPRSVDVAERPEYAGCKTWVALDAPIATEGAVPVLAEAQFAEYVRSVTAALNASS